MLCVRLVQVALLLRINNPTSSAITWTPYFYYSCYGGWNEYSSVAMNGNNVWSQSGGCAMCTVGVSMSLAAGRTSTIIFVIGSSPPAGTNPGSRGLTLAFYGGSFQLPSGLVWVDDLANLNPALGYSN